MYEVPDSLLSSYVFYSLGFRVLGPHEVRPAIKPEFLSPVLEPTW